jgi:TolB protein
VRSDGTKAAVVVFDAQTGGAEKATDPTVIFEKPDASPFYLYWTPDGRSVSFLATENEVLSLRLAPADGSAPVDGSSEGSIVGSGNPFYYDWLGGDRLFAHIGTGAEAFIGEVGLDGEVGEALDRPGDFRSAVVSPDHASIAFVRGVIGGPGEVVVSGRDGSNEHSMTVFGQTALAFDPNSSTVGSIAASDPGDMAGFPLGPLRLIDVPSGDVRTLLDGAVASLWWSPDGRTIAALRVQPRIGSATPSGEPAEAANEIRLIFVDVASGRTLSQPVVRPAERFVTGVLAYFDQYALSHRLWAPDSSAFLMPEIGEDGRTRVTIRHPDGAADPILLDGVIAFWSP